MFDALKIDEDKIVRKKEYYRIITSPFSHINSVHLNLNVVLVYIFGLAFEKRYGALLFSMTFFSSYLISNILAVAIHKSDKSYNSSGASGGILGVIFFLTCSYPSYDLAMGLLPFPLPSFSVALLFITVTVYAIITKKESEADNVVHLTGSLIGVLMYLLHYVSLI